MKRRCKACNIFRETRHGLCDRCVERIAAGGDPRKANKVELGKCVLCETPDIVIGPTGVCAECAIANAVTPEARAQRAHINAKNDLR